MKTDCFYRVFSTAQFEEKEKINTDEILHVVRKNDYVKSDMYFDEKSEKWLCFDGKTDKNVFEYAEVALYKPLSDLVVKDRTSTFLEDYSPEQVRAYLEHRKNLKRYNYAHKNLVDERGLNKNFFSFEVRSDFDALKVTLVAFLFKAVSTPVENNVFDPRIEEIRFVFDVKNGKIFYKGKEESSYGIESDSDLVPPNVAKKTYERVRECAEVFTGVKLEETRFSEPKDIMFDAFCLTKIPFEKNLYPVLDSSYFEDCSFKVNRADSKIYNNFCKFVKIKSHRMLRKSYMEKPESLITYHKVKRCGISDVNLFNKVLSDKTLCNLFNNLDIADLSFFCKKFLKARSELSLLNILKKTSDKNILGRISYEVADTLDMFNRYYRFIPRELKKDIFEDGLTTFNHDALSELSYKVKNKNRKFSYNAAQKSLQDEINGYEFCLPVDTDELAGVGIEMRNCVASYADDVLKKNCTIVYAKKNGKKCLCIEIRGKKIYQELAVRNRTPDGEEEEALLSYHARHSLAVD